MLTETERMTDVIHALKMGHAFVVVLPTRIKETLMI